MIIQMGKGIEITNILTRKALLYSALVTIRHPKEK
jgi:hypothetical protein